MSRMWTTRYAFAALAMLAVAAQVIADSERRREVVIDGPAKIVLIPEGMGPLIVMPPSRGCDSQDFDEVAARPAKAGYRVLRPQPRSTGSSVGLT